MPTEGGGAPDFRPIRRVTVIGAGAGGPVSGAFLASLCVEAGFETILEDVLPGNLRRAAAQIGSQVSSQTGSPTSSGLNLRYAASIEDAVRDADLVIDTVPDELESKLEILSLLDRMAPPHTLFATPTETLSIADLASCTYRPGHCFGLRFGSLAPLRVELRYPLAVSLQTLARAEGFFRALKAGVRSAHDTFALP